MQAQDAPACDGDGGVTQILGSNPINVGSLMFDLMVRLLRGLEFLGFILGKEGVYLSELAENPTLVGQPNWLIIETSHSLKNSAKEVYHFEVEFRENKCFIRAFQKLVTQTFGKRYRQEIPLGQLSKNLALEEIEFYWVDPDHTLHSLQVTDRKGDR